METNKARTELVKKISEIMREVGAIPKSRKNSHFGYSFRGHEDIMNKLQPVLAKHGVIIIPKSKKLLIPDRLEPGHILIESTFEITDGNESIEFVGIGEGLDRTKDGRYGDKSAYKAQTGAAKYALNDLLQLAGEDPEDDNLTHAEKSSGQNGSGNNKKASQSKPGESNGQAGHTLSDPQRTFLTTTMSEMGYSTEAIEDVLRRAKEKGFEAAKTALLAKKMEMTKSKGKEKGDK